MADEAPAQDANNLASAGPADAPADPSLKRPNGAQVQDQQQADEEPQGPASKKAKTAHGDDRASGRKRGFAHIKAE